MKTLSTLSFATLAILPFTDASDYKNVLGNALSSCSSDGMALTGYTRSGYCVDQNDDYGSHHICIDMTSTAGGDFCSVTGQSDWCSSEMPCHEDQSQNCQVKNWCVCQWAFASYIENAGGCDSIQDVVCDAINMQALIAYKQQAQSSQKYQNALRCVMQKCGIEQESSYFKSLASNGNKLQGTVSPINFLVVVVALAIGAGTFIKILQRGGNRFESNKEGLMSDGTSSKLC